MFHVILGFSFLGTNNHIERGSNTRLGQFLDLLVDLLNALPFLFLYSMMNPSAHILREIFVFVNVLFSFLNSDNLRIFGFVSRKQTELRTNTTNEQAAATKLDYQSEPARNTREPCRSSDLAILQRRDQSHKRRS